jgi:hypothetical protein
LQTADPNPKINKAAARSKSARPDGFRLEFSEQGTAIETPPVLLTKSYRIKRENL